MHLSSGSVEYIGQIVTNYIHQIAGLNDDLRSLGCFRAFDQNFNPSTDFANLLKQAGTQAVNEAGSLARASGGCPDAEPMLVESANRDLAGYDLGKTSVLLYRLDEVSGDRKLLAYKKGLGDQTTVAFTDLVLGGGTLKAGWISDLYLGLTYVESVGQRIGASCHALDVAELSRYSSGECLDRGLVRPSLLQCKVGERPYIFDADQAAIIEGFDLEDIQNKLEELLY